MLLNLNVIADGRDLPAVLTVSDERGGVIIKQSVGNIRTHAAITACTDCIVISFSPIGSTYHRAVRFIKLCGLNCRYELNIHFPFRQNDTFLQNFYLYDKNYFLPIRSATLYFSETR